MTDFARGGVLARFFSGLCEYVFEGRLGPGRSPAGRLSQRPDAPFRPARFGSSRSQSHRSAGGRSRRHALRGREPHWPRPPRCPPAHWRRHAVLDGRLSRVAAATAEPWKKRTSSSITVPRANGPITSPAPSRPTATKTRPTRFSSGLSHQFEMCAYGLGEVRREWERRDDAEGPRLLVE